MVHRGPDDEGFEEMPLAGNPAGPVAAFGFRRLAILDEFDGMFAIALFSGGRPAGAPGPRPAGY